MIHRTARDQEWNRLGARAVQVWGEAAATGWALAGIGAFCTLGIAIVDTGGSGIAVGLVWDAMISALVAACGLLVGMIVGIPLGLLVRFGEPRLGPRAVGRLMPVIALSLTTLTPLLLVAASVGARPAAVGILVLDATFTFAGAVWIARRYRRRAEVAHLH